jgi:hypothetical protein
MKRTEVHSTLPGVWRDDSTHVIGVDRQVRSAPGSSPGWRENARRLGAPRIRSPIDRSGALPVAEPPCSPAGPVDRRSAGQEISRGPGRNLMLSPSRLLSAGVPGIGGPRYAGVRPDRFGGALG